MKCAAQPFLKSLIMAKFSVRLFGIIGFVLSRFRCVAIGVGGRTIIFVVWSAYCFYLFAVCVPPSITHSSFLKAHTFSTHERESFHYMKRGETKRKFGADFSLKTHKMQSAKKKKSNIDDAVLYVTPHLAEHHYGRNSHWRKELFFKDL